MTDAHVKMVGPVVRGVDAELADAVIEAMAADNPESEVLVDDRGGYIRISVPMRARLTRASLAAALGHDFQLSELEPSLSAFAGRLKTTDDEFVWYLERRTRDRPRPRPPGDRGGGPGACSATCARRCRPTRPSPPSSTTTSGASPPRSNSTRRCHSTAGTRITGKASPFQVDDWEDFRDPFKLTYKDYVSLQHEHEVYLDGLVDRHEETNAAAGLDEAWVGTLRQLFVPLRFPLHGLQMVSLYVGQMAPSSFITNPSSFQAADEMRRVQRIAYWTKVLANAHGDDIATTATAKELWVNDAAWQPFREAVERLLVAYDWGEAFTALNLAVKPVVDALLDVQLSELASRNGDQFIALMFAEFGHDAARSQEWPRALVSYALGRSPELRDVLSGWLSTWTPRAEAVAADWRRCSRTRRCR